MRVLESGRDPERGRLRRVPRGVGEEVVEHLHHAPAVGHHGGQTRGQVDEDCLTAAAAHEGASRPLDQGGHVRGLRRDRERARVDAPGVQQVADQSAHVAHLLGDDAEELTHLGPVELGRLLQQHVRRALDGNQRRAQLVAHQAQELGTHPFDLVERRQVLHGHHQRADGVAFGTDRRGVDQHPDAASAGHRQLDLLAAQRLAGAEMLRDGELAQGHLPAVGALEGDDLQELLERAARRSQALAEPLGFAIDRQRPAATGVEDHDPDRRGLDQGLEVGPARAARCGACARWQLRPRPARRTASALPRPRR